jgi:hypothetical protein
MDELERTLKMPAEPEGDLSLLLKAAAEKPPAERRGEVLQALVVTVSKVLRLSPDELAVLMLTPDRTMLRFVHPVELAQGGGNMFPVTVPSVAGRVVQTGRIILNNVAHEEPHLGFYERIRVGEAKPRKIQKLLAVPVKGADGRPQAVIEASRRGNTLAEAGPNFSSQDQQALEGLATMVGPVMAEAFAGMV